MIVGIVGASGYSGEVLVDILSRHPEVSGLRVASRSLTGTLVEEQMPALRGRMNGLTFINSDPEALARNDEVSVWFLALPHGVSAEYALHLVDAGKTVIDLSADFRLSAPGVYEAYYGKAHSAPEWLSRAPYVIPELAPAGWRNSPLIACPGCYPTSILVPLYPLIREQQVDSSRIVINSMSGVSGAGKKASEFYSFCERSDSVKAYGLTQHRHLSEVEEQLSIANGNVPVVVQFNPHLVPMPRGIATTITVPLKTSLKEAKAVLDSEYTNARFVTHLAPGETPDTRYVIGKNRVDIGTAFDERTQNLVVTSVLDNLVKGASGQAVQIFNLKHGFDEASGLS